MSVNGCNRNARKRVQAYGHKIWILLSQTILSISRRQHLQPPDWGQNVLQVPIVTCSHPSTCLSSTLQHTYTHTIPKVYESSSNPTHSCSLTASKQIRLETSFTQQTLLCLCTMTVGAVDAAWQQICIQSSFPPLNACLKHLYYSSCATMRAGTTSFGAI